MINADAVEAQDKQQAKRTYWLSVYTACQLHKQAGAPSFDEFLKAPWVHLEQQGQADAPPSMADGYEPLLPAQVAVARRLANLDSGGTNLERQAKPQDESHANVIPLSAFNRTSRA